MAEKRVRRGGKKNRKWGRQKRHPAAIRYLQSGRLAKRKIRNLVRHCGVTKAEAERIWYGTEA